MAREEECVTNCEAAGPYSAARFHDMHRDTPIYRHEVQTPDRKIVFYSFTHPATRVEVRHWTYEECVAGINAHWTGRDKRE